MTVNKAKQYHRRISRAVRETKNQAGGVYTREIVAATGQDRQVVCRWLKEHGYEKDGGHMSNYWRPAGAQA